MIYIRIYYSSKEKTSQIVKSELSLENEYQELKSTKTLNLSISNTNNSNINQFENIIEQNLLVK